MSVAARIACFQLLVLGGIGEPVVVITDAVVHVAEFSVPTVALFRPFPTCAEFSVPTVATFRQQVTTVAAFNAPSL